MITQPSKTGGPRRHLETRALLVAYAMSRLDRQFLRHFRLRSWQLAFQMAGQSLDVPPASMKNLRDEFDPLHPNSRKGWHKRPLRPNRQRILGELCDTGDLALLQLVERIFSNDPEIEQVVIRPLSGRRRGEDVAERLRTGRAAEMFVLDHSTEVLGLSREIIIDRRDEAIGFDFGRRDDACAAIEVKGLRDSSGAVTFTDHEWATAARLRKGYLLVVVGCVHATSPRWVLIPHPSAQLKAHARFIRQTSVSWSARVTVE